MKYAFVTFLMLYLNNCVLAQNSGYKIYTLEEALISPKDSVFGITLRKNRLTKLPDEIYAFENLMFLDVSKNKLKSIPMELNQFKHLEVFMAGKNKLTICPIVICSLPSLKILKLNENPIGNLPECIQFLTNLEELDLFQTRVESFPETLVELKNLKKMDVRGILYGPKFQEQWKEMMPQTFIDFDLPCNCIESN